jgi:tetratricopeptide (TPR) repeat protein
MKFRWFLLVLFFLACNDGDHSESPFGELLSRPPYEQISDSIRDQPTNDELYFRRAVLLNKNNLPEPALVDFQKAWRLEKQEKYAYAISNIWLEKNPDSVIVFMEEALEELPASILLRFVLARTYEAQNLLPQALDVCTQILGMQPDNADALLLQSQLQERSGDMKSAVTSLEKAYALTPGTWPIAIELAYKYAENKHPKTIPLTDSLILKDTLQLHAQLYYIKGVYYSNINEKAKAIAFFDQTISRDHNYHNAYVEKGKVLLNQKKTVDAFRVFSLLNRIKPSFPDGWFWIGACQEELGQLEDARLSYQKAYALDKTFVEAKEAADRLGGRSN